MKKEEYRETKLVRLPIDDGIAPLKRFVATPLLEGPLVNNTREVNSPGEISDGVQALQSSELSNLRW